jgi:hypothetical protein
LGSYRHHRLVAQAAANVDQGHRPQRASIAVAVVHALADFILVQHFGRDVLNPQDALQ